MKRRSIDKVAVLLVLAMALCQNRVYAMENVTVSTENRELISVVLPMVEEREPFSFFIDPLHIFYNTFGDSDGEITVEEDTYLLFYNRDEGGYTLSSRSDRLKIINKSTIPVQVTITAKLENADGISVMQDEEFEDRVSCDLYLALVDNEGREQPLSEDGEVSVTVDLDRAPIDAYAYVFCEDTGEYQYVCQSEDVAFDSYSFGLRGACNGKGDWAGIGGRPQVTVSWNVEPIFPENRGVEDPEDLAGDSVSGNDVSGNGVPGTDVSGNDVPGTDVPGTDVPGNDVPGTDGQGTDGQGADGQKVDSVEASSENADIDTGGSVSGNDASG